MAGRRGLAACLGAAIGAVSACGASPASSPGSSGEGGLTRLPDATAWATLPLRAAPADAASLALTLYSDGWAMVSDSRPLTLAAGTQVARFAPVAVTTDARGALLEAPGTLVGTRFRYDAGSRDKLLERFDGKRVEIFSPEASQTLVGTLIAAPAGPLIKIGDRLYTEPPGKLILPGLGDLALQPTLDFLVAGKEAWSGTATASYLANQIGWTCEYTLTTDKLQSSGNLSQWAAMRNGSGATYRDAQITLVVGESQRGGHPPGPYPMRAYAPGTGAMAEHADVAAERFAVRYQYRLPERLTLGREAEPRVLLGGDRRVAIARTFRVEEGVAIYRMTEPELPVKARVRLTIENTEAAGLGIPLPVGRIAVFTPDARGKLQLAGEASIPDTPKDQKLLLDLGEAFDVTAKRTQTAFKEFPDAKELAYRIVLKNTSDAPVTVDVIENMPGDWSMLSQSHDFERISTSQIRFRPEVPAGGETVVTYAVRINEPKKPGL